MTVKANRGWCRSLRPLLCMTSLLLCGASAAQQGQETGQAGTGQSSQPSTSQTGTSGTASQTNQAGGAGRTNQTGDASRGQTQGAQGESQTTGASRGSTIGGWPGATQTSPTGSVTGGAQLPGAARVTQG